MHGPRHSGVLFTARLKQPSMLAIAGCTPPQHGDVAKNDIIHSWQVITAAGYQIIGQTVTPEVADERSEPEANRALIEPFRVGQAID